MTLAEVLVVPAREERVDAVQRVLHDLEIQELPFPDDSAVSLAQLRVATGLRMPDCCVLLAAEHHDGRVASFAGHLTQTAQDRGLEALEH